jgi:hypothetical protein
LALGAAFAFGVAFTWVLVSVVFFVAIWISIEAQTE